MTTLQRAVARRHDHNVSLVVGQTLGLDVSGFVEVLLDEAFTSTECGDGFARRGLELFGDFFSSVCDLEAASTATERRLDSDGESVNIHEVEDLLRGLDGVQRSGCERCANLFRNVTGTDFVPETFNRLWRWPNPYHSGVRHGAGKVGVLGEESVAGVNGVGAGSFCCREDLCDHEVGVGARCAVQADCFIGHLDVLGINVLIRINRNGRNSRIFGCANHANRNFTAVSDKDLGNAC